MIRPHARSTPVEEISFVAMKRFVLGLLSLALCTVAFSAMTFVHPGAMSSQAELDFVKARIAAGAEPWTGQFNKLKGLATGGTNALVNLNSNNGDANTAKAEARKAYANALAWAYTGNETYAKQAIALLNAWSGFQGFTGGNDQDKLQAGWIGALFAPAAEIMLGYAEWAPADIANLRAMFRRAFYPQLTTASNWNGNVDLTQIDAMMNIAVFNEDEALFNAGLERLKKRNPAYFYLAADGGVPRINGDGNNTAAFWSNPTKWVDGLTQETCRDNGHHAQYAPASALHAAEVAWHQGVDVYTENTARYTAALELMASQLVTGDMQGTSANPVTSSSRFNTFEVGFNHYQNRRGIALPNTLKAITQELRPKGQSDWNIFYETLTHGDLALAAPIMPPATGPARLISLAARVAVGGVAGTPISGFVLSGPGEKPMLIRAVGPSLASFGVCGALSDPRFSLVNGAVTVSVNDNWLAADAEAMATTGAFALTAGGKDAALLTSLSAGAYTAPVTATDGGSGIALLEIYEAAASSPATLINGATRAYVGTGESVLIPGFVIGGTGTLRLLIRAVGPTLENFNVADVLADPTITLYRGSTTLAINDNWSTAANAAEIASTASAVGAFALPNGSRDAAILTSFTPGAYTVIVSGVGATAGTALVELYSVP